MTNATSLVVKDGNEALQTVSTIDALMAMAAKETGGNLAAILAKLSSDPATQTTLAAILAKLTSDPATQTTLAALVSANHSDLASIAALLTTQASYLDGLEALLGTSNTSLASILTKLTSGYTSSATITRPNNTNTYPANGVVGAFSSPDQTGAFQLLNIGPSGGGEVLITSSKLEIFDTGLISGETSYNAHIYSGAPPSAYPDLTAFDIPAGDRASRICKIPLGTPVDEGSTLVVEQDVINKQITVPNGGFVWAYLVTAGGYVATAQRVFKLTFKAAALG